MKLNLSKVEEALLQNELSGNKEAGLRLSWAGNSNSGISFGYQQIDTKHNNRGFELLTQFGVSQLDQEEIKKFNRTPSSKSYNEFRLTNACKRIEEKIKQNVSVIEKEFENSVIGYFNYFKKIKINELPLADERTVVQLIDYHNQFHLDNNGKLHKYLLQQDKIDSELILKFKLENTKWGQTANGQRDIRRRFKNIDFFDYKVKVIDF